jgi:hypothetical protein
VFFKLAKSKPLDRFLLIAFSQPEWMSRLRVLPSNGNLEIGTQKVVAFEQQWLVTELGQRIAEAVAEIQSCGVTAALAVLSVRGGGEGRLITRE